MLLTYYEKIISMLIYMTFQAITLQIWHSKQSHFKYVIPSNHTSKVIVLEHIEKHFKI
jgi:hypothetical protein